MQIARWLLREPSSRDGDVCGERVGSRRVPPRGWGDTLYPGPPSRQFLAVSVDTRQGLCPFSTLGLAPCLWGDVEGDRVEAGCSRPPGSPPASVLFGQQVFSLCRALGGTWWPSQNGQFSLVMGACDWLWQQLDLGAHKPHVLVTPEGTGVADEAPPPLAAAGLPD